MERRAHGAPVHEAKAIIDGVIRDAADGATSCVVDPATGEVVGQSVDAGPAEAREACDAAAEAQRRWARQPPRQRSEVLRQCWSVVMAAENELAALIVAENGKPLADARSEVRYAAEFLRWNAEQAVRIGGSLTLAPSGAHRIMVQHPPVGVVAVITPWNFPLAMLTRKIAPALAAGNAVVVKPSEQTPLTADRLVRLLQGAGVPDGVVNLVPTTQPHQWVDAVLDHTAVRMLSFTGSSRVGRLLLGQASQRVIKVGMELGGNAPFVVLPEADLDAAVDSAMVAKMRHSAQTCTAADRFYVHTSIHDEFVDRLARAMTQVVVGDGRDPDVTCGPLIDRASVRRVAELVEAAVADGATSIVGSVPDGPGSFHPPTVVVDVRDDADLVTQEIFGPVAPVLRFDDIGELLARINDTESGLAAYVHAGDAGQALALAEQIQAGMVAVNRGTLSDPAAPFGGMRQSGLGREGGSDSVREFCETRYLAVDW